MKADSSALITKLGGLGILSPLWSLAWCQALLCLSGREHRTEEPFVQHNICFFATGKAFARKHQCWVKHKRMSGSMTVSFPFFVWLQCSLNFFNSCWLFFSLILWIQKQMYATHATLVLASFLKVNFPPWPCNHCKLKLRLTKVLPFGHTLSLHNNLLLSYRDALTMVTNPVEVII